MHSTDETEPSVPPRDRTGATGSATPERDEVYERLGRIIPDLPALAAGFAHETINRRPGLDPIQRELVILGALLAAGAVDTQLQAHARAAQHAGLSTNQIGEVVLQALPYVGFPRAINGALALERLLAPRAA